MWPKKTWITKDILRFIKIQSKLYSLYKSSRNNEDLSKYKAFRHNLFRAKNKTKAEYYRQLLENSCVSSKTWKVINKILNNNKTKFSTFLLRLKINDNDIANPSNICKKFN